MTFGKVGRPPEDRLARQREIYEAVSPLILEVGARELSMRDAARAACLSIGGLYHYFPTKRDLVLYGLQADARDRLCRDYRERISDLAGWSLDRYIDAYLDNSLRMFAFVQPAVRAALELGAGGLQAELDAGFARNVGELTQSLRCLVPRMPEQDLEALARAIRNVGIGVLVDRTAELDEFRDQLRVLIEAYMLAARPPQARSA